MIPNGYILLSFATTKRREGKKSHRCRKFPKNLRHSLNCGNSSLRSSDSPQFLTLIPRFSLREFPEGGSFFNKHQSPYQNTSTTLIELK